MRKSKKNEYPVVFQGERVGTVVRVPIGRFAVADPDARKKRWFGVYEPEDGSIEPVVGKRDIGYADARNAQEAVKVLALRDALVSL